MWQPCFTYITTKHAKLEEFSKIMKNLKTFIFGGYKRKKVASHFITIELCFMFIKYIMGT